MRDAAFAGKGGEGGKATDETGERRGGRGGSTEGALPRPRFEVEGCCVVCIVCFRRDLGGLEVRALEDETTLVLRGVLSLKGWGGRAGGGIAWEEGGEARDGEGGWWRLM